MDTGCFYCFACQKALKRFRPLQSGARRLDGPSRRNDDREADPYDWSDNGNCATPSSAPASKEPGKPNLNGNVIDVLASMKGVSRSGVRAYGAQDEDNAVCRFSDVRWRWKSMFNVLDEPKGNQGPK